MGPTPIHGRPRSLSWGEGAGRVPANIDSKSEMKRSFAWVAGLWVALVAVVWIRPALALELPSSQRSLQAVHRRQPSIEKSLGAKGLAWGAPIYLRIFKAEKKLELWIKRQRRYHLFKSYPICTYGRGGIGPKLREGDGRSPEGFYFVAPRQMNPHSNYHLAFNLGYPNVYDRIHGRDGSALMVHGSCVSIGCFAMTDTAMEEIYVLADAALRNGQPFFRVHIFPFKMTDRNMRRHLNSPWYDFWCNLKSGHDWFADHGELPPDVKVRSGRYTFKTASY